MTQILHICTAGSVDDGKSTLIGQLLYQTHSIPEDKWAEIERASLAKGLDFIDLSLLTDGLIMEREKGITIDVAYIYFASQQRKYILADTPGHFEYTRNMITGASQSQVCVIMVDALKGLREQTHRHLYIACLLGLQEVIFCVNKMDLIGYDKTVFEKYIADLHALTASFDTKNTHFSIIPISALQGENIVFPTQKMPWYKGDCLLSFLEKISLKTTPKPVRFAAQSMIKTKDFQGIAGKLVSGNLKVGDELFFLQQKKKANLSALYKGEKQIMEASEGESLVLQINPPFEAERGEYITIEKDMLIGKTQIDCILCWLDEADCEIGGNYFLQQVAFSANIFVKQIKSKINIITLQKEDSNVLKMNDIAFIRIFSEQAIFIDDFSQNPANGRFILIDKQTNHTVALGLMLS